MSRPLAAFSLAVVLLGVACQPTPTTPPVRPGATNANPGATGSNPGATAADPITPAEANVITGRVTTAAGTPLPEARMRIVGYTGGATLGRELETVETGDDGVYRSEVPTGLYEVLGQAPILFDRQVYVFDLEPADGDCAQQMSNDGIVKDFVLRLTGLKGCLPGVDPENYAMYHGAAIQLFDRTSGHGAAAVVVYSLEPIGSMADGSTGQTLELTRTVGALQTSAGPISSTWILHDIPLARYRVSAALQEADGRETPLLVSSHTATTPASAVEISFDARALFDEPTVGYSVPQLYIHDA